MLGSFNVTFYHKFITSEAFRDIHQFVLNRISDNMTSLVQSSKYGVVKKIDSTTTGYYIIQFILEAYTLQWDTACDGQISTADKLVVRSKYLKCTKEKTKWYWDHKYFETNHNCSNTHNCTSMSRFISSEGFS